MRRTLAITAATALLAAGVLAPTGARADNRCYRYSTPEKRLHKLINRRRDANNVRDMRLDAELSKVATVHTKAMVRRNLLFHSSLEQLGGRVTRWSIVGEAVGQAGSIRVLNRRLFLQPAHRVLMLDARMRHVGVGVVKKGGRYWGTVVLSAGDNPGTTLPMPDC